MFSQHRQTSMTTQIIVIRDKFAYYVGELNDTWITNETSFNPEDYYYESSPPMNSWALYATNRTFNIHGTAWQQTTITAVVETLTVNNNYHIPVVCINTPNVLEYFKKIPISLMLVNGKPTQRPLAYTATVSSPRLSNTSMVYTAP